MQQHKVNPTIDQFRRALQEDQFKRELAEGRTPQKALAFEKWRAKLPDGPDKQAADEQWERYLKMKDAPPPVSHAYPSPAQAVQRQGGFLASPSRGPAPRPGGATNTGAGDPAVLGEPFHNPYTFIPFAPGSPRRHRPTPLTIDEDPSERHRFTGVLDLTVTLLSPLMTLHSVATAEVNEHRTYDAQVIGDDFIVPATGVRGALRSLMTLLTGGTLGHLDEEAWLCQGRDARLGPVPDHVFLAEVIRPGTIGRPGTIRLGKTKPVRVKDLETAAGRWFDKLPRPRANEKQTEIWSNEMGTSISRTQDVDHLWRVKLSGRPINEKGKREGLFLPGEVELELPSGLWSAYSGRHRHSVKSELRSGDLVWLEPVDADCTQIESAEDVKSIQWARWGRTGERLLDVVAKHHPDILPDAFNPDGKVDEVTDLFGQVPRPDLTAEVQRWAGVQGQPAGPFAARIRAGNLVFRDARRICERVTLAPLAPPHPGCAAFYRSTGEKDLGSVADVVSNHDHPLRGYKVYRTTNERGAHAPWRFDVQGVYDAAGKLERVQQRNVNKTAALLPEDGCPAGRLRIALRALTVREITLLLAACSVDWRLGGGKPLGLGHCRVTRAILQPMNDDGTLGPMLEFRRTGPEPMAPSGPYATELEADPQLRERMKVWQASQEPIIKLRYPRAVLENKNRKSRGGHVWFARHAQPRKAGDGEHPAGLQALHLHKDGGLQRKATRDRVRAQPLPPFEQANTQSDALHGYDLLAGEGPEWSEQMGNRETHHKKLEPFDAAKHSRPTDQSGGATGQSRATREDARRRR